MVVAGPPVPPACHPNRLHACLPCFYCRSPGFLLLLFSPVCSMPSSMLRYYSSVVDPRPRHSQTPHCCFLYVFSSQDWRNSQAGGKPLPGFPSLMPPTVAGWRGLLPHVVLVCSLPQSPDRQEQRHHRTCVTPVVMPDWVPQASAQLNLLPMENPSRFFQAPHFLPIYTTPTAVFFETTYRSPSLDSLTSGFKVPNTWNNEQNLQPQFLINVKIKTWLCALPGTGCSVVNFILPPIHYFIVYSPDPTPVCALTTGFPRPYLQTCPHV